MYSTLNLQAIAPLHEIRICGIRQRKLTEFHEYKFDFDGKGAIRCHNSQFRLIIPKDDPRYAGMVESGHAMDMDRHAAYRARDIQETVKEGRTFGNFIRPIIWVSTRQDNRLDFTEVELRTQNVLENFAMVDNMRSTRNGVVAIEKAGENYFQLSITEKEGGDTLLEFPFNKSNVDIADTVSIMDQLFTFTENADENARRWVTDKIVGSANFLINNQPVTDMDLLAQIPNDAFLFFDGRRLSKYFIMPPRWCTRHIRFEIRSPHRITAYKAAGVDPD